VSSFPAADDTIFWTRPAYARIVGIARERAGLTFPENRREITESALRRAMAHAGEGSADRFASRVASDPEAYSIALTELTVGETYFFRDPAQWSLIREHVVPELLATHPDGHGVRAWSAGCASGEEAYTLGIVLRESGCVPTTILGTDLCEHRLGRASRGVYTNWSMRGVDESTRRRYFSHSGQYFHLLPEFRGVAFRPLNLASNTYGTEGQELFGLDLILCRNVLIYIAPETTKEIFARLAASLRPGGWLMVAASDPQPDAELPLDVVVTEAGLLYRKHAPGGVQPGVEYERALAPAPPASRPAVRDRYVAPAAHARSRARMAPARLPQRSADSAYRTADYDGAIQLANREIASGDDTVRTWVILIRADASQGRLPDAVAACARAIARYPDAPELHIVDSTLAAQHGQHAAAVEAARRAVYLDRSLAAAHVALGMALLCGSDVAAAGRSLRAAERLLAEASPAEPVEASDGASAAHMLATVRAHRALLMEGGLRAD
jgi:Methylase of chemotaxis methyl-accepting proteins